MPIYTLDNPCKDLDKARQAVTKLLGDKLQTKDIVKEKGVTIEPVTSITPNDASRISVHTISAVDTNEICKALAELVKPAAAVKPDTVQTPANSPTPTPPAK